MPLQSKSLKEATGFSLGMASLFCVGGLLCLGWAYSRGAFGSAAIIHPVNLAPTSAVMVRFSVPRKGDHDLQLWYSRKQSVNACDDLDGINGKAIWRVGDAIVQELSLPVRHYRFDSDGCAMVLFTGAIEPGLDYSVTFEIDRIPESLAKLQPSLKIDLVSEYGFLFLGAELLAALLFLGAFASIFFSIRWWRAASVDALTPLKR